MTRRKLRHEVKTLLGKFAIDLCSAIEDGLEEKPEEPASPPRPKCRAWIDEDGILILGNTLNCYWSLAGGLDAGQKRAMRGQINTLILEALRADRERVKLWLKTKRGLPDTAGELNDLVPLELPE